MAKRSRRTVRSRQREKKAAKDEPSQTALPEKLRASAWFLGLEVAVIIVAFASIFIAFSESKRNRESLELARNDYKDASAERTVQFQILAADPRVPPRVRRIAIEFLVDRGEDLSRLDLSRPKSSTCTDSTRPADGASACFGLDFANMDLAGAVLNSSSFRNAQLLGVNFEGAQIGLSDFTGSDLRDANLSNVDAAGAVFVGADMTDLYIENADFQGADFSPSFSDRLKFVRSNLRDTNFSGNNMSEMSFRASTLQYANFADSRLVEVNFSGTNLTGADFSGAVFMNVSFGKSLDDEFQGTDLGDNGPAWSWDYNLPESPDFEIPILVCKWNSAMPTFQPTQSQRAQQRPEECTAMVVGGD